MITTPGITERDAQPYVGIRTQVTMQELGSVIPQFADELFDWLDQHGIAPAGPPFTRYHVIDMDTKLDIEVGIPVATTVPGNGRIASGILPAGRYASLIYTDVSRGIEGNAALIGWGQAQGLMWDQWPAEKGDAFGGRVEFFLSDPEVEPDPSKWETEVAIRLADN
jgi:effector-binding domain-containing protein